MKIERQETHMIFRFLRSRVVLSGPETKSVRSGGVSIVDAFANIDNEEAFIMEMNIEHTNILTIQITTQVTKKTPLTQRRDKKTYRTFVSKGLCVDCTNYLKKMDL